MYSALGGMATVALVFNIFFCVLSSSSGVNESKMVKISLTKCNNQLLNHSVQGKRADIILKNVDNLYYTGLLQVGSPPQELRVNFDTGSPVLWVSSSAMCATYKDFCRNHRTYNHTLSNTHKNYGRVFKIDYVEGYAKGIAVIDDIMVGGLKIRGQVFGEIHDLDDTARSSLFDGVFGLGFSSDEIVPGDSPLVSLVKHRLISQPMFAVYLSREGRDAELSLGGLDASLYTGNFTFVPLHQKDAWHFYMDKIYVADQLLVGACPATPDSGTSYIVGPPALIDPLNRAIGARLTDGMVDCKRMEHLPTVYFVINTRKFPLYPQDYTQDIEGVECYTLFQRALSPVRMLILGDIFLQRYYTQFDHGQRRVGFATAK